MLSPDEVRTFRDEIDQREKGAAGHIPFEPDKIGQSGGQFSMMEASTSFTSSLAEDDRLAGRRNRCLVKSHGAAPLDISLSVLRLTGT